MDAVWMPVLGGGLVGLGLAIPLVVEGYSEGACGLVSGIAVGPAPRRLFRAVMLLAMALTGAVYLRIEPSAFDDDVRRPLSVLVLAGVLCALGTRLANGCTSGHGILGIGRGAPRSFLAIAVFTATAMVTVALNPLEPAPAPAPRAQLAPLKGERSARPRPALEIATCSKTEVASHD